MGINILMNQYFSDIINAVKTFLVGMKMTLKHYNNKEELVATLQYPHEKWPVPDRNIGFENSEYNLIRSRLHVDIDDCIGCLQCERVCPVDCIKIETVKKPKKTETDFDFGITSNDTAKKMLVSRFSIDMSECMYCNLCAYPCPEECIYMVGGPNAEKHEIDYEFSKYEREGLVYEFAFPTDDDLRSLGANDYIEKKQEVRDSLDEGARLEGFVEDSVKDSASGESDQALPQKAVESEENKYRKTKNYSSSEKIGLFYGSSTGNSEAICDIIQEELGESVVEVFNVSETDPSKFMDYNHIIISCPTWYEGELQEDWIEFLPKISKLDLKNKKIVMFGMGDQVGYADNFLDALGLIAEDLTKAGASILGEWPTDGYEFNKSVGLTPDGKHFYGLGLDQENQDNLHLQRLDLWFKMLVDIFSLTVEDIPGLEPVKQPDEQVVERTKEEDKAEKAPDEKLEVIEEVEKVKKSYTADKEIGLFYGSSTGNSEAICDIIQEEFGEDIVKLFNVSEVDPLKFLDFEHIIVSCPTWNDGELQEDWIEFLPEISKLDLKGKKVIMFGMGDQDGYADNFLDALGIIAKDLSNAGASVLGEWSTDGYEFNKSLGVTPDGEHFYGLGLDEENQSELHGSRLEKWFLMVADIFNINSDADEAVEIKEESVDLKTPSASKDNVTLPEPLFEMKLLNGIEDKMARGSAKKIYLSGKKEDKNSNEVIEQIRAGLEEAKMMDDDIDKLLNGIG